MLTRDDCDKYEQYLMKEIAERRPRGGYSPEATTIIQLCSISFELIRHIRETLPPEKRKAK